MDSGDRIEPAWNAGVIGTHLGDVATWPLPKLVLLKGKMCAGKDFIGDVLVRKAYYKRFALADPLKQEVADRHGITVEELNRRKSEFRSELQAYGQSQREKDPLHWVKKLVASVGAHKGRAVVTDVRYENEVAHLSGKGLVVHVGLPEDLRRHRVKLLYGDVSAEQAAHSSEAEVMTAQHHIILPGNSYPDEILPLLWQAYAVWHWCGRPMQRLTGAAGSYSV